MDLKRLGHLVALADTRNFGRAALQCHLSQPAFSRSIQAAEEELGLLLFDRGATEITCTDAGAFVVERARRMVFDGHCLERDVRLYRDRQIGDISLGTGTYSAETLVPGLLTELRMRFSGVKIRVEVNNTSYLYDRLRAEELDFFLADVRMFQSAPELVTRSIERRTTALYVRKGHPLLARRQVSTADLRPFGLASVTVSKSLQKFLAVRGPTGPDSPLLLAVECGDIGILKQIAMTTDTVAALPDLGAAIPVGKRRLIRLVLDDMPPMVLELGVVSLKGRSLSPIAQFAVNFLVATVEKRTQSK